MRGRNFILSTNSIKAESVVPDLPVLNKALLCENKLRQNVSPQHGMHRLIGDNTLQICINHNISLQELQRQKLEYESKKKIAEQLRIQHEEQEERERRRLAAQRVQEEQQALLSRQREVHLEHKNLFATV
ncbi:hypothetical protein DPMN_140336 [Dreissena polymorpha]|uniref:Uncharacterized protein n=1 Tax=Dreissena polymorpha TaxID=45954 RepID=A0A9D4GA94_DREPO|nr:hypothetical protein DPMN_140336 [Dreissena polymorpha]